MSVFKEEAICLKNSKKRGSVRNFVHDLISGNVCGFDSIQIFIGFSYFFLMLLSKLLGTGKWVIGDDPGFLIF